MHTFASDNYAGIHPEILAAIAESNSGHAPSYGGDEITAKFDEVIGRIFGAQAIAYPVFNGTGANVVALQTMVPRWGAVICAETAHINTDENGAPERIAGIKLTTVPTPDGKLTPELVDRQAKGFGNPHHAQPAVVSISQVTELGTVYKPEEIGQLADHAHSLGMWLHLDGARLANAAAALGVGLAEAAGGADVISLGATKNGAMGAEAIIIAEPAAAVGIEYVRKMDAQLASKMRFISAQLVAMFGTDLWRRNAAHANEMAQLLASEAAKLPGIEITQTVDANAVFAIVPRDVVEELRAETFFYDWDTDRGVVRWMCSFDTTAEDVTLFVGRMSELLASRNASS